MDAVKKNNLKTESRFYKGMKTLKTEYNITVVIPLIRLYFVTRTIEMK